MHSSRLMVLTGLLMVATIASAGTVYKWTDPDGNVTYGELPPPDVEAIPVDAPPPRPAPPSPDHGAPDETADTETSAEPGQSGTADEQTPTQDPEAERQRVEACEAARQNQAVLEDPSVRRIQVDGGEAQVLTPEQREEHLARTREFLETWCTEGEH